MKIRVPKGLSEDEDVNPFTKEERDLIIKTFACDRYYKHYTNYVRFLFFTGARHRKSYQCRHTFISLCVEAHINSTAIGRWTGTSAKMIDKHYGATNFTNLRPPDST
ncbi:MAG: hypothetical protein NW220_22300 [Leptolyngbyaceae cyanobacterium bins.349]|nr:hypothetical protein [Leptolyngbyaceae cyanobacterium bins.349]